MLKHLLMVCAAASLASACVRHSEAADVTPRRMADLVLPPDGAQVESRVGAGGTLASLLRAGGVREQDCIEAVELAAGVFNPRKLRADQPYRIDHAGDGLLRRFEYEIDGDRLLHVARPGADLPLTASVEPIEKTRHVAVVEGRIDSAAPSLFAAMTAAGESIELPISLAAIFGGEIDFSTDLQPGDTFTVVVEKQYRADDRGRATFAGYGPIAAAEFDNAGRRFRAFRYAAKPGDPSYFDERGVSLRRFFLRSPLKFEPIVTSGFSHNRFHPILREYRPHLGVDYKAPIGAPVVASADGVVVEAGMSGGAGRLVHLRHGNGFESEYLHLSSIAVRVGARVRQGELIGRVGASGLATGPHLDYRLKKNGAFINPLTALRELPPADPVPAAQMTAFRELRDRALHELEQTPAVLTTDNTGHQP